MIDLAKKLNNDSEMIRLAQIFVQQPRNAVRPIMFFIHNPFSSVYSLAYTA